MYTTIGKQVSSWRRAPANLGCRRRPPQIAAGLLRLGQKALFAARLAVHEPSPLSHTISVPVFVMILILTRLFVAGLDRIAVPSLLPLLVLQFFFLLVALSLSLAASGQADP